MKWKWYIMKENKNVKVREKLGSTVSCKHCGKPFTKKHRIEYYCSDECRHEVELAQWRKRSQRHRDKKKLEKQQMEQQMEQMKKQIEQLEKQMAQQQVNDSTTADTTADTDNAQQNKKQVAIYGDTKCFHELLPIKY